MIIAVDFDGVLNSARYPALGEPMKGAKEAMETLHENHHLIIWTCREGEEQTRAVNWLLARRIPFDAINANHPDNIRRHGGNDCRKVFADLYIDDRQVGGFTGWQDVLLWVKCLDESAAMSAEIAYDLGVRN